MNLLHEFLKLIGIAWVFSTILMALVWWISFRISNLGIVDVAWSLAFAPLAVLFAVFSPGFLIRRELICAMVAIWSFRLGLHVAIRVARMHPHEDPRYREFREKWSKNLKLKIFVFFQIQALSVVALAVPLLIICLNGENHLNAWEWIGLSLWIASICGESLADHQLNQFKADPANQGEVCQTGLWHYSRHPNYFFEAMTWVAYWLFALGSPLGCATIYCPALMLYFLLRVTGIPLTERQSLKSKGEKFRAYQRTTSMFVPWFPKRTENNLPL